MESWVIIIHHNRTPVMTLLNNTIQAYQNNLCYL